MLISKIPENDGGKGESIAVSEQDGDSHEYQTANELFELMAKNQNFDTTDVDKLTTRDLVLLYKNIDLGTKLMSNANELKRRKPNQRVESVVYNDESDSDVSERFSSDDLLSVFRINDERLDLINPPSAENTLCHKLGDLRMRTSNLATDYDKHFLFKDPYIHEQLKSLKLMNKTSDFDGAVLPASLLDYICCKRLEDNYNFYMDNIIRYVKNTIDHLKRISNGDYLTDKAKEKWREVVRTAEELPVNTKVLATSTSIPLHVERNISGGNSTWDDIVHSAVDVRSLSKILEKKIVVEVPKLLCGPYKLLSKCAENLIISCKKNKRPVEERLDVVLQLQRSETGQVMSNINSIMILQSAPVERDTLGPDVLPLPLPCLEQSSVPYIEETNKKYLPERKPKIIELEPTTSNETVNEVFADSEGSTHSCENPIENSDLDDGDVEYICSDSENATSLKNSSLQESSDSNDALKGILDRKIKIAQRKASRDVFSDDLRMTMRKLTMQSAVTEESGEESQTTSKKRKSPTRVRIKSPYENQSFMMEEKKRRKLLEIREKRERKKMALAENCKIVKHKYAKGTTLPQSASSVTKLSISNKSFYNSIYGQAANGDPSKQAKGKNRKGGKRDVLDLDVDDNEGEHDVSVASTPDNDSKKYINRSYYLDEADTEMMYINMKQNENDAKEEMMYINMKQNENDAKDPCSTTTSVISNVFRNNLNYLSQLIGPSESDLNIDDDEIFSDKNNPVGATRGDTKDEGTLKELLTCQSVPKVPENSPKIQNEQNNTDPKKSNSSVECRKSIEKIYTLMNTLEKAQENEHVPTNSKLVGSVPKKVDEKEGRMSSTCQGSESGTSLKHHITSSNPSSFSFDKNNTEKLNNTHNKKPGSLSPVTPKVIISSKSPPPKTDLENNRKHRKKSGSPTKKISENPLKAISQLLHEFENVQKNRQKPSSEQKHAKKLDMVSDAKSGKSVSRKSPIKRRSRLEQHNESEAERFMRLSIPKEKKPRQLKEIDTPKIPYQIPVDDKHTEKPPRKKIIDILDEAKEARGEAVRGPSKLYSSRLNSLAQPKRSYVQAHSEEYQTRYGKNLMADRLQRLAATSHAWDRPAGSGNTRNKAKRSGPEAMPAPGAVKPPSPVPPPERVFRTRHSHSSSPEAKERLNQVTGSSFKQGSVPETPQALKKKMVAVESYVKNHYGRTRPISPVINDPQSAEKSRVPLLPNDIELASSTSSAPTSFQESTELGSRLHNIISSIMRTTTAQGLEILPECHETTSLAENISCAEIPSSDSDYVLDILDDNNVKTSVENTDKVSEKEQKVTNYGKTAPQNDLQLVRSVAELEKLENALCNHIPLGSFQKRLRIKNLTMTPKQSMHNVFVLQSGDAGSLVVQTPIAQNMKNKSSDNFSDLTVLPVLSKSHLDWNFTNFPMKIATVGYAFPDYKSVKRSSNSFIQLLDEMPKKSKEDKPLHDANYKSDKGSHTSISTQPTLRFEQAAQVDILAATTLATVGISTSTDHVEEPDKKKEISQANAPNTLSTHVFTDCNQIKKVEDTFNCEQTQIHTVIENKHNVSVAGKHEDIQYTTSLDILVGLLNEIQNISTCQTQMTKGDKIPSENEQNKVLETILINEAVELEHSLKSSHCDVISFTSLDRLRQLESNPSLYSFYLSSEGSEKGSSKFNFPSEILPNYNNELWCPKRIYVDKEVDADFIDREVVSKLTDIPSQLLPATISHSTDATHPLIRVISEPSIESMLFAECPAVDINAVPLDHKSGISIPHILITTESKKSLDFYDVDNQINKRLNENKSHKKITESFEKERIKTIRKANNDKFRFKTDFDPTMKMKRDILVTVYSILVFTVFAALSFPEMLYRI